MPSFIRGGIFLLNYLVLKLHYIKEHELPNVSFAK